MKCFTFNIFNVLVLAKHYYFIPWQWLLIFQGTKIQKLFNVEALLKASFFFLFLISLITGLVAMTFHFDVPLSSLGIVCLYTAFGRCIHSLVCHFSVLCGCIEMNGILESNIPAQSQSFREPPNCILLLCPAI